MKFRFLQKLWTVAYRQKPHQPLAGHYGLYIDDTQAVLTLEESDSCCNMALRLTLAFVSCRVVDIFSALSKILHLAAGGQKKCLLFMTVNSETELAL